MLRLKNIIKALLLANTEPVTIDYFLAAIPAENPQAIQQALAELVVEGGDVYTIKEVEKNYYSQIKNEYVTFIKNVKEKEPAPTQRRALLETLAVIVMRQPIKRSEIEYIRGVNLNISILHDLQDLGWIKVVKVTKNDAHLYGTTIKFLQDFGLSSVSEFEQRFMAVWLDMESCVPVNIG